MTIDELYENDLRALASRLGIPVCHLERELSIVALYLIHHAGDLGMGDFVGMFNAARTISEETGCTFAEAIRDGFAAIKEGAV